jgi:membrane protein
MERIRIRKTGGREDGHAADSPGQIPRKGFKQVLLRVKDQVQKDHISIIAAGIAFFIFLALFPAIAALLSIYGLIMDPQQVQQQMNQVSAFLPAQAHQMISEILQNVASQSEETLGLGVAISVLVSLWSANKGTKALFEGVNVAYKEEQTRGFFKENGLSLLFTLGGMVLFFICLSLVVAFPVFVGNLGLPEVAVTILDWSRWLLLGIILMFAIAAVYNYAPVRRRPKFRWVSWGAVVATVLWLLGSLLFSFFVSNFGNYDETYGSVAGIVILMLWFFMTALLILIGAEINSELEHQTSKDTTVGGERPLGQRGAQQADRVYRRDKEKKRH